MKRKHLFRTVIIIVFTLLGLLYIYPTFNLSSMNKLEKEKIAQLAQLTGLSEAEIYSDVYLSDTDFSLRVQELNLTPDTLKQALQIVDYLRNELNAKLIKTRGKAIKEGLDLQGGMHLVLEVDLIKLADNMARKKDDKFYQLLTQIQQQMKQTEEDFYGVLTWVFKQNNVPLNAYFGDLRTTDDEIIADIKKESEDAVNRSLEILRNRVDQFGVSEPSIQKQGGHRIVIELPGVQDPTRARALIGKTALLEFKLLADADKTQKALSQIDDYLRQEVAVKTQTGKKDTTKVISAKVDTTSLTKADTAGTPRESKDKVVDVKELFGEETTVSGTDTTALVDKELMEEHPFYTLLRNYENNIGVPEQNYNIVNNIIHRAEIQALLPSDYQFLWSKESESAPDGKEYYSLYYLKKEAELTGRYLRDAQVQIGGSGSTEAAGLPIVTLEMNREGARVFARVTGANVGKFLAIVLDNKVHMAPRVKTKIPDGRAIIEGSKNMNEAKDLSIVLRAGALPAPVEIIEERTVGPSLGEDSIAKGTLSAIVGTLIVMLFMIWYYRLGGLIADVALILNLLFLLAILAGFHGTLTMPGIAGIVLTMGMAVDANVLIYERIREELRWGKTIKAAIEAGYARALVVIFDANITTLMSAIVLYQFGTGPIRGFALTLMIGITASMFTSIVVTRAIFDWITEKFELKTLPI